MTSHLPRRPSGATVDRRTLIATAGAAGAALSVRRAPTGGPARPRAAYFRHGVASGDPRPRSVVLWTRVTPTEAAPARAPAPARR